MDPGHEGQKIQFQSSNEQFVQPNVLQLRLDTQSLLDDIHVFLRGKRLVYYNTEEGPKPTYVDEGEPRMNDEGAQAIVGWLSTQMNSAVVQGNWREERFMYFCERTRKELAKMLLENGPRWKIKDSELKVIISSIMNALEGFMSRLIENKERESYANSLASTGRELVNPNESKRRWF